MLIRLATTAALACGPAAAAEISLSSPIACPAGLACPVQNLFDHDPGPKVRDFRCTELGYDGHDGVDFRVPTLAAQKAGVEVRAAAEGVVLGMRDGMADVGIKGAGREALKNVECGNGVLLRHDGFDTQYCHMAQGSLAVKKGDRVRRGQTLGRVGMSGMAEFPHLHFTLRIAGKPVDPFALDGPGASCGPTRSAWEPAAAAALNPAAPLVLNAGFADGPVPPDDIESGAVQARPPSKDPPALVAWSRTIGLATGDVVRVSLIAPDGGEIARNEAPPFPNAKAQWSAFAGRKRPPSGWSKGLYRSRTEILRGGAPFRTEEATIEIGG